MDSSLYNPGQNFLLAAFPALELEALRASFVPIAINIPDRLGVPFEPEEFAGSAYGVPEAEYERLIAPLRLAR